MTRSSYEVVRSDRYLWILNHVEDELEIICNNFTVAFQPFVTSTLPINVRLVPLNALAKLHNIGKAIIGGNTQSETGCKERDSQYDARQASP